ncbi:MAG: bifunctional alpha/beta hydrolase/class I SAM-dependent methyltransferase [Acidobacteriia bacterium]|nr:bifunctional alpha/beta hydrolase/class I SAM-dependent methyltransferase [Terriglobia bacterium]
MSTAVSAPVSTRREPIEQFFPTWDGVKLFYRAWLPASQASKALVLIHRGHEHSGRFQDLVDAIDLPDFAVFAWDARGHGRSPGQRGYAEHFSYLVRDLDSFVKFLAAEYGIQLSNMGVLAHSVGAVLASTWIHDYAPPVRALVLASPAFRVKLYVPFALLFLRLQMKFRPKAFVKSYVKAAMLTHDREQQASYTSDPLIARAIAVNILIEMYDASTRVVKDASAISVPTLLLASGNDWVVKLAAQRRFFDRLCSRKKMTVYPGFYHDLFHEQDRALPIRAAREFILECFGESPVADSLLSGDRNRVEYESLSRRLPAFSPAGLFWSAQRIFLKTVGQLSEGIRTGWRCGFDSGQSLDYVYRNQPHGITPLGKLIDRIYLSSPGWRGIRVRKTNLQRLIRTAIEQVDASGRPVQVLDVATGGGRYLLELLKDVHHVSVRAQLRDWDQRNLDAAQSLAKQLRLTGIEFAQGDAFDRAAVAAIRPRPNVAIVSGLYELFADNQMVLHSLQGIADAAEERAYLIYTNQPWHPQLHMIARVLDNREGKPWVMRCRSQAEMDELVRRAGFEKLEMLIDDQGIFTVSLARRLA